MSTDWKALCAELLEAWDELPWQYDWKGDLVSLSEAVEIDFGVADRARAALAAGDGPAVPEGREPASVAGEPSDDDIMGLMPQQMHDDLAAAARALGFQAGTVSRRAMGAMRTILNRHAVDLALAALARWDRPAPAPRRRLMTDWRALCAELLADYEQHLYRSVLADKARAALAEPQGEGVTDDEWDALVERSWDKYQTVGYQGERFMYDSDFGNALDYVRKELARYGHQPALPAATSSGEKNED